MSAQKLADTLHADALNPLFAMPEGHVIRVCVSNVWWYAHDSYHFL